MLLSVTPTNALAADAVEGKSNIETVDLEDIVVDTQTPIALDAEDNDLLSKESLGIKPRVTDPDDYESNDTFLTAYPYNQVADLTPKLTAMNQLWTLGMKHAGLHSETDEDWFSINLTAGTQYFVDLRNIGRLNWYIELYYVQSQDENGYYSGYKYTTDPEQYTIYKDHPEKYFYFTAQDTGTYYIRITSGDDWEDTMHYFFYVGPAIQSFAIENMVTMGGVKLMGSTYATYTCDLSDVVPAQTEIVNLYVTDSFSGTGTTCGSVNKCLTAGGKSYYGTGTGYLSNIAGVSLGQSWTIGGACSHGSHTPWWSARLNGRFRCVMAPYPGNEL